MKKILIALLILLNSLALSHGQDLAKIPMGVGTKLNVAFPIVNLAIDAINAAENGNIYYTLKHITVHAKTASHTLDATDDGAYITMEAGAATDLTIPAYSTVPFDPGTQVKISSLDEYLTTIVPGSGVTIVSKNNNLIIDTLGSATLVNVATNRWKLEMAVQNYVESVPPVGSDLLTGLLGYWKMTETSGTTLTDEVGSSDGTSNATPTANGQDFNSADHTDYIYIPAAGINPTADEITISFEFTMDTLASVHGHDIYFPCSLHSGATFYTYICYISQYDNKPYFVIWNSTGTVYSVHGTTALSLATPYHYVAVCNGNMTALELYINGTDVSTTPGTFTGTNILAGTSNVNIGKSTDYSLFDGLFKHLGIWNIGLTSTQVTALYNSGTPLIHPFE